MNNDQFRRLIQPDEKPPAKAASSNSQDATAKAPVLGSRARSSIPMTPRSISAASASSSFARQLADYKARNGEAPPAKKFKSAAPKGSKFANGYVDRTALRRMEESGQEESKEDADKKKRLQALEEMMKLGQMDKETFLKLRKELGFQGEYDDGQKSKGLDFDLLERTRRGEVELDQSSHTEDAKTTPADIDEDFEAALDAKAQEEVAPVQREMHVKKGTMAAPPPLSSSEMQNLSRNEILKRLKANRATAAAAQASQEEITEETEPVLGTKFKKIGGTEKKRWIETDENGRRKEILLTTDKDGNPKRKVRWLDKEPVQPAQIPESKSKPSVPKPNVMGMEVPAEILARQKALQEQQQPNSDDDDIFAGVGSNYNPLENDGDDDSDQSGSEDGEAKEHAKPDKQQPEEKTASATQATRPRNYFATSSDPSKPDDTVESKDSNPLSSDPTILAALKRAAALRKAQETDSSRSHDELEPGDAEAKERHQKFLENLRKRDREDAADLDLGFGESRFGDDEDEDGPMWDEDEKKSGRKRGPKKRKGNKDSVEDVMSVLEGRKKGK